MDVYFTLSQQSTVQRANWDLKGLFSKQTNLKSRGFSLVFDSSLTFFRDLIVLFQVDKWILVTQLKTGRFWAVMLLASICVCCAAICLLPGKHYIWRQCSIICNCSYYLSVWFWNASHHLISDFVYNKKDVVKTRKNA